MANIDIKEKTLVRLATYLQKNRLETLSEAISCLLDAHDSSAHTKLASSESGETLHDSIHDNSFQTRPTSLPVSNSLEIVYFPSGEENFKRKFLEYKRAYIRMFYEDGKIISAIWNAQRFTENSSIRGNLASGYLRGWRKEGIYRAEVSIEPFANSQGGE